jgi:hypothetical protein
MNKSTEMKNDNVNEKTETQNLNWMSWEMVMNIKNMMKESTDAFKNNKMITPQQFELLLSYLILCLYTDIPPRRNQDYMDMYVVESFNDNLDKAKNYFDWSNKEFIFQHYKTSKKYGKQTINIKDKNELLETITLYLKFHPLNPNSSLKKMPKNANFKFLVYSDGSPLSSVNAITRILNKIFGRKIGSSMLRHIYLTSKYDIKEMKEDAQAMGHSLNEQRQYLKEGNDIDTDEEVNINIEKTPITPKTPKPKPIKSKIKSNVI